MKANSLLLFFVSFLLSVGSYAQRADKDIQFMHIGSAQGLSNNTVMSIVEDKYDMLWFATFDGLNRYDGYTFKKYHHQPSNEGSILSDLLRVLFIDNDDQLWIGSKGGLSLYIREKDSFENFILTDSYGKESQINTIIEYNEDQLMIGSDIGLNLFDKAKKEFVEFPQINNKEIVVRSLSKQNNSILIGTDDGLYIYDLSKKYFTTVHSQLSNVVIQSILSLSETKTWIGTEGSGLYLLNLQTGEIEVFRNDPEDNTTIASDYIRSLAIDSQFQLWVGTFNGLSLLKNGAESFENYNNLFKKGSLSQNSIRTIFKDSQDGMWLGTFYGGLNYYHPLKNQFGYMEPSPNGMSLNDKVLSCILEDEDSREIWLGTNDNGINVYNPHTQSFRFINKDNNPALVSNNIKVFLNSKNNKHIYVGIHGGGLLRMNKKTGDAIKINLPSENVYALSYGLDNDVWIGTLEGLFCYNETTDEVKQVKQYNPNAAEVYYLNKDSKNRLWIGGEKSLSVYSLLNDTFIDDISNQFDLLDANRTVNSIVEDEKNTIWIGTYAGLSYYDEDKGRFEIYSIEDGLSNNVVYGIIDDSNGNLWISTNNGLNVLNPKTNEINQYFGVDGLPFNQFNRYSFCKTKNGLFYFGGVNGLITFYPESLKKNPVTLQPRISKIQIANKEVTSFDNTGVLQNDILETDEITLKRTQTNIGLEIVVSNYLSGKHNLFAYKLDGFDDEWIYTSDNRFITYSNIPPGKYTFLLKAANNNGVWSDKITKLGITVLPYWWETWWAIGLFIAIALVLAYIFYRFMRQRQLLKQQVEIDLIEREKMKEVNQMKMRFFINVSHEFKTPLSLIISPIQEMIERNQDTWAASQLNIVYKNASKLLHLVNQLMDYRRTELGVLELNVSEIVPEKIILNTYILFERLAQKKNIEYNLENETGDNHFLIDSNYFEMILSNLLSNAFKFTPQNGMITVRVKEDSNNLILEVEDDGCGIQKDKQALIFDRYYQIENSDIGTGIGLSLVKKLVEQHHGTITVKSEENVGSVFTVLFPKKHKGYDETIVKDTKLIPASKDSHVDHLGSIEDFDNDVNTIDDKDKLILLVEDDEDILNYLSNQLSERYQIVKAKNGVEALEKMSDLEVDLVVTDVMMDKMDGVKLCKKIKQNIQTCHIPVIMLSAKSNVEDQLKGFQVGADDYVSKPFTFSVLSAKIQNMLKSRKVIKEFYSKSLDFEPEKVTFNELDKEILANAKNVVLTNIDNAKFSAQTFSTEMGMSRSNLHLKLKALTGESTIDFIKKIRFSEASKLLLDGRYNIAEISTMVGFNSPSYFATSFKKHFGCLPTEYINNKINQQN